MTEIKRSKTADRIKKRTEQVMIESEICKHLISQIFPEIDNSLSYMDIIKSGVYLAQICNKISPDAIKISYVQHPFHYLSNLSQVRNFLLKLKVDESQLFVPQDVVQQRASIQTVTAVNTVMLVVERHTNLCSLSKKDKMMLHGSESLKLVNSVELQVPEELQKPLEFMPLGSLERCKSLAESKFNTQDDYQELLPVLDNEHQNQLEQVQKIVESNTDSLDKPQAQTHTEDTPLINKVDVNDVQSTEEQVTQYTDEQPETPQLQFQPIRFTPIDPKLKTFKYKLVILGDSGTGKSCICKRLTGYEKEPHCQSTISIENHYVQFQAATEAGQRINVDLNIQDTAGMERFRSISTQYVRTADVILLVFAHDDVKSLQNLKEWLRFARENNQNARIILIGNKADQKRNISAGVVQEFIKSSGIDMYVECSAKVGYGVGRVYDIKWAEKEQTEVMQKSSGCC
ncbi:Rab1a [Hexamita inflata]|uniref:Rab1a n=1 Tax=Hexamita inflata TaxID=28002 RepID=A0AA86UBU2_9EUKA|nr:Rab1a [Hexamita inflata]